MVAQGLDANSGEQGDFAVVCAVHGEGNVSLVNGLHLA